MLAEPDPDAEKKPYEPYISRRGTYEFPNYPQFSFYNLTVTGLRGKYCFNGVTHKKSLLSLRPRLQEVP